MWIGFDYVAEKCYEFITYLVPRNQNEPVILVSHFSHFI